MKLIGISLGVVLLGSVGSVGVPVTALTVAVSATGGLLAGATSSDVVAAQPSAVGGASQLAVTNPGSAAEGFALAQVGTPYRWGGERVGVGFDCSGLVQAAWRTAGVALPRVAQDQFDAGPPVPAGVPLEIGDLVFFGSGPGSVTHVGLVVDPAGVMVDAPHTGAVVRTEPFPATPGAWWGDEIYVGATRPGAG